jgi:hypothetical protein
MDVDGFNEVIDLIYIAKKLYDMGKYDLVEKSFFDVLEYDTYYCGMYDLIGNLFEHSTLKYYEHRNFELHVLSDPVIVDFYKLAGQYGKLSGIPEGENTYLQNATAEVDKQFNISHCMSWMLMGHTEPNRPFHSRIGIIISHDCACCDIGIVGLRLINIYTWFDEQCDELKAKIAAFKPLPNQMKLHEFITKKRQAMAA